MGEKFLVWIDIMGFEEFASNIAKEKGLEERKVRLDFIRTIRDRIDATDDSGSLIGKTYGQSDDWLLVIESLDLAFKVISEILSHHTGYEGYEEIPLEIAIGVGKYDKWARYAGAKLIAEESTIRALKENLIKNYHSWYEKKTNGQAPKSTFIVLTRSAFEKLEPLEKEACDRIDFGFRRKMMDFFVADTGKILKRGKMCKFLENIGCTGSKWYSRVDDVYVKPAEYERIRQALSKDRIVFITGTAEYGKTYTSIKLLWDYYNRGYEPIFIRGSEEWERGKARERLEEIERELQPHSIMYFEDPFGKTKYEKRESLERKIGNIIDCVKSFEDVYVIVTSREEIFKEFQKEHLSSVELRGFEKTLNIKNQSYGYEERKKMLLKWAKAKGCVWLEQKKLRDFVLASLKDEKILPTPLTIRDYSSSTTTIVGFEELEAKLKEKSKETAISFAREIMNMSNDKVLFLLFPFTSSFTIQFVAEQYKMMISRLKIKPSWDFEKILGWFMSDKIAVSDGRIQFSHSSYSEAIDHLLVENGILTQVNREIYRDLLLELSKEDSSFVNRIVWAIAKRFNKLPNDIQGLLFELSERDSTAHNVVRAVAYYFGKFPEEARKILTKLSKNDNTARTVAWAIAYNFAKLPDDVRDILTKLSKRNAVAIDVAHAVTYNFAKLPEVAEKILSEYSDMDHTAKYAVTAVATSFHKLDTNLRNELLQKLLKLNVRAVNRSITWIAADNFAKFPEEARKILTKLSKNDNTARTVARATAYNFAKLPEEAHEILTRLSKRDRTAGSVAHAIAKNYGKLPDDIRDILTKLSKNDKAATSVAGAIAKFFDKVDKNVRNELLLRLSKKEHCSISVAKTAVENFGKFPEEARKILTKLSKNDNTARAVAWAIASNFYKLPDDVRDILTKLSKNDNTARTVARATASNFAKLPEEAHEILTRLSKRDRTAGSVAHAIAENYGKLPDDIRDILTKLSKGDSYVKYSVIWSIMNNYDRLPEKVIELLDDMQEHLKRTLGSPSIEIYRNASTILQLISESKFNLNKDFLDSLLRRLAGNHNLQVRYRARKLLALRTRREKTQV